ncbi:uncharacterized protein [Nicotiana sylvestris]|uniref:uncharacterized protein n=1 Tax=Nicotiana sylvestris TaxID=4096 RepID=UPI00388C5C7C
MLKKDTATKWIDDCQRAFDKIKDYLSTPPVLVPPEPANFKGVGIGVVLVSETGKHYLELRKRFTKTEFQHVPRIQNEFADALATLSFMIQHPDKNFIDPILVKIHEQPAYCARVKEEADGKPWFHDIKEYLMKGEYSELSNPTQKCTLRRLSNNFFHSGGILYRRTPNLGLLRLFAGGSHGGEGFTVGSTKAGRQRLQWGVQLASRVSGLMCLRDRVQHDDARDVTIGDDGVLRMQGRICVPNVDGLRELIQEEDHR